MDDYKKAMSLGSWLGRFMSASLSPWDIESLADNALKLLNIEYVREATDPVVNGIMTLLQEHDAAKLSTIDDLSDELKNAFKEHANAAIGSHLLIPMKDRSEKTRKLKRGILIELEHTFYMRGLILNLVHWLQRHREMPWNYVISLALEKKGDDGSNELLQFLLSGYNSIRPMLIESGPKVELVNCMECQIVNDRVKKTELCRVQFPDLISRIFIDFLVAGGREYCGLCKHCGTFIIGERKGRREYCGGRCRIAYKRQGAAGKKEP